MDISKPPINASQSQTPNTDSAANLKTIISDIHELKLEAGKVYSARVIQAKESPQASTDQTIKLPGNILPGETKSNEINSKNPSNNEWLILVKGKVVLISSEKPLANGQKLLLKLAPSLNGDKPTLIAQLLTTKASTKTVINPAATNPTQASAQLSSFPSPTISPTLTQGIRIEQLQDISRTANQKFNNANIQILLQALNLTLDKQLPLQQGLQTLDGILKESALASSKTPENEKALATIKTLLIDKLPKLDDILKSRESAQLTSNEGKIKSLSANLVKQNLLESGVFLERTLLSQPNKLLAFKEALSSLEHTLPSNTQLSPDLQQNYGPALKKIQQTIESLLQLATNQTAPTKSLNTHSVQFNDLKANLLSSSSLLIKQLAAELSAPGSSVPGQTASKLSAELAAIDIKNIFLTSIAGETLASPFVFPMISATQNSNLAKALFDKQEFTTGQILKLLAGMIHKLQFHQLHSLLQSNNNADNPLQQTWFFELPVLTHNQSIQTFNFRIDKEPQETKDEGSKNDQDQEFEWKLLLSFDLDALGPIYIQIKLLHNKVSSELWADRDSTYLLLNNEVQHFRHQLVNIGLDVGEVTCKKGQPNQKNTKIDRHLVDTKA